MNLKSFKLTPANQMSPGNASKIFSVSNQIESQTSQGTFGPLLAHLYQIKFLLRFQLKLTLSTVKTSLLCSECLNWISVSLAFQNKKLWLVTNDDLDHFPDLWGQISSLAHYVRDNLTQFLQLFEDLSKCAQYLLVTSKNIVKSLTCDNLELPSPDSDLTNLVEGDASVRFPPMEPEPTFCKEKLDLQEHVPSCTPWLLASAGLIVVSCVLALDAKSSGHTTSALDDVLMGLSSGMRAKLSYFSPPLLHL
ncbi:hypothetical protein DSO57_1013946 [Entomophthora muscae]|uniref:Uncharacterized protein n=1 Tax=Entomophthora muscae TaxID=34485 RepID=A0ACC2RKA8_9FUNG|nr:hypothetical protein DSO57_1013946 [Entomophthora muscae]